MDCFLKLKPKKDENQKALKKNSTLSNLIPWEIENRVEMLRCQVTGPKVEHYFSLIGCKCILHFWHAQNECPFAVHTCIDRQFENSKW